MFHNPRPANQRVLAADSIARATQSVIDALEPRKLLSDNIYMDVRQLVLIGSARRENVLTVELSRDRTTYGVRVNGERTAIPASQVDFIKIVGGRYADSIILNERITLTTDIYSGNGADTVIGGSGSDNIVDPSAGNRFYTGAGDDFIRGGPGDETVYGGAGNDIFYGGGGIDRFYGEDGNDYFDGGGDKKNIMYGGPGNDTAVNVASTYLYDVQNTAGSGATASALTFRLANGVLNISGASNVNNVINVSMNSADTYVVAALGVVSQNFNATGIRSIRIVGGAKNDFINVSPSVDIPVSVEGGAGNDTIYTGAGPDIVNGGTGDDRIFTGAGNDSVNGGAGNDLIYTEAGNDSLSGGDGNDRMDGGAGRDFFDGGDGEDYADGGPGADSQLNVEHYINIEGTLTGGIPGGSGSGGDDDGGTPTTPGGGTPTVPGGGTPTTPGGGTPTTPGGGTPTTPGGGTPTAPGGGTTVDPDTIPDDEPDEPAPPPTGTVEGPSGGTNPTPNIPSNPVATAPGVQIYAYASTIKAGQAAFVHGLNSDLGSGNVLTSRFEWDFGDPNGKYNNLVGFNASHVYDTPGTYKVTLKIINNLRGIATASFDVTVTASGRRQIFVSENGNDNNDGSQNSPIKSFSKAAAMVAGQSNVEVLFKRGEGFATEDSEMTISGDNVRITSYGSGDKPWIYYNGPRNMNVIFRTTNSAVGTTIENLIIDSRFKGPDANRSKLPHAIKPEGHMNVVRNVTFLNVGYGINANAAPTGLLVQDNDAPTDYGLRSYLLWAQGKDIVVLGNKVVNSTHEHPMRFWEVERVNVAYNDLANPSKYDFETLKTAFNFQAGTYAYIYANTFRGPRLQIGPLGGGDGHKYAAQRTQYVVFEANHTLDTKIEVEHGAENVVLRNNVLSNYDTTAIDIDGFDSEYGRGVVNLSIINNTILNLGTKGRFIALNGSASGIDVINNLYRADKADIGANHNAALYVVAGAFGSFRTISNNVWPAAGVNSWIKRLAEGGTAINIVGDPNNINSYLNLAEWNGLLQVGTDYQANVSINGSFAPAISSIAASSGIARPGVLVDYYGNVRPADGPISIGAVEV